MRQIICLITDGRAQYAVHDSDTDELIEFAQVLVPDEFDFRRAALLGVNLANSIVGNGVVEQPALPAAETAGDRKRRRDREYYRKRVSRKPTKRRYITLEEVLDVIGEHPEGIMIAAIAAELWKHDGRTGNPEHWMLSSVSNRLFRCKELNETKGEPIPYTTSTTPQIGKDGQPTLIQRVLYHPVNGPS